MLVGIRAENIRATIDSAPTSGEAKGGDSAALVAETLVVEPLGSHLLVTATIEGQQIKVITRTDFETTPGQRIWLRPEPDKLRWLRPSDGVAIELGAGNQGNGATG